MKRKRQIWRSILCVLAAALLLTASPLTALEAHAVTQAEIDSLKEQLKELEAQAQALMEPFVRDRAFAFLEVTG